MKLAPVIIFNYNRPDHSLKTWETLSRNLYAAETELYLFCDGPKKDATEEIRARVFDVQKQARQFAEAATMNQSFKVVHVVCSAINKGLANSIIEGVSEVIEKHERVIVLEDDLLTSPYFLKYMNEALDFYASYPAVFSISADRPPVSKMQIPSDYEYDVFVSLRPFSYGWATWRLKWESIDWSMDYLDKHIKHKEQIEAFNRGGDDLTEMLIMQRDGKIDSWAIRYAFEHFYHHAIAILPCVPYIDNIGFDGTGIHSGTNENDFRNDIMAAPKNPRLLDVLYEDKRIINAFYNYYCRRKRPIWQKAINFIWRTFGKREPFVIKQKVYA